MADGLQPRLAFRPEGGTDIGKRALFLAGDNHHDKFVTHKGRSHDAISSGAACFNPMPDTEMDFKPERYSDNWSLITLGETRMRIDFHANANLKNNPGRRPIDIACWTAVND